MSDTQLHVPAGSAREGDAALLITPAVAGWHYAGLRVIELAPGGTHRLETGDSEHCVLPLAGGCAVEVDGERFELAGRPDPFSRVTDFAYLPRDAEATISAAAAARIALPSAPARRRLPVRYGPAEAVPIEVRGAGSASRQINNFMRPDAFEADRLTCVEVLTPEGNTSSYPPHKHDADEPSGRGQAVLEEIYYFEVRGEHGFGLHRTYTADGEIDATVTVRSGDAFLIPRGFHGPCVALPGHDLYTLTVLAGPAQERSLAFVDDERHAWIRASWDGVATDPRLPMCDVDGPVG